MSTATLPEVLTEVSEFLTKQHCLLIDGQWQAAKSGETGASSSSSQAADSGSSSSSSTGSAGKEKPA